jgi:hypothetical protein
MGKRIVLPPDNIADWVVVNTTSDYRTDFDKIKVWLHNEMASNYYVRFNAGQYTSTVECCFESSDDALWFRLRWS